jgi:hypothetical protein
VRWLIPLLGCVVSSGLVGGCNAATRGLAWEAAFQNATVRDRAVALEAEIRSGGCIGTELYRAVFPIDAPPTTMGPPSLAPGRYGFHVAARAADCVTVALGCTEVSLPQAPGATVRVSLEDVSGTAACPADACQDGLCDPDADAGPFDAGPVVCDAGATCGGSCTDLLTDPENCGACGTRCRGARGCCVGGACASCP